MKKEMECVVQIDVGVIGSNDGGRFEWEERAGRIKDRWPSLEIIGGGWNGMGVGGRLL